MACQEMRPLLVSMGRLGDLQPVLPVSTSGDIMWGWRKHSHDPSTDSLEAARSALAWLPPDARALLASLHNTPPSIAEAVLQLVPFGSRAALLDQGVTEVDEGTHAVSITPFGYLVMREAASDATKKDLLKGETLV